MLKNYLKIGIRNLFKHRLFTFINVTGLGIGLACCILIGIYIHYELSYDRYYSNPENVFRILVERTGPERGSLRAITPRFLSSALKESFPEIESAAQFRLMEKVVGSPDKEFPKTRVVFTDNDFFKVFTHPAIYGNLQGALISLNSAILTKSFAEKIFGNENPVGKSISIKLNFNDNTTTSLLVAALIEDVPQNSHFKFDIVLPYNLLIQPQETAGTISWDLFEMRTYIRFNEFTNTKYFEEKLVEFVQKTGGNQNKIQEKLILQPLTGIHLSPEIPFDDVERTNIKDIYIFAGIALLVLLIACINYIILITARYTQRIKEVGVRKILGASPGKLAGQFLTEAALIAVLALPLAFAVVDITNKEFAELLGKQFHISSLNITTILSGSLALVIFFTFAAGLYPAFFLARINSVVSLKGGSSGISSANILRKSLVVMQFCITVTLLICIGIMYMQLEYTRSKDLGYKTSNVLVVETSSLGNKAEAFKRTTLAHSAVDVATYTGWLPGFIQSSIIMQNPNGEGEIETQFIMADCDLLKTFQMEILEGRGLDCNNKNDVLDPYMDGKFNMSLLPKISIILNEKAVKALNLSSPVGLELHYPSLQGTVIGVIKDIHNLSLHSQINPMVIKYSDYPSYLAIAYKSGMDTNLLQYLKEEWRNFSMKSEFSYFFLNDYLQDLYLEDEKLAKMIRWFAILAIILSCLGLFGLTAFIAQRRTKEIGIRKILGATVFNVTSLLSKDFVKLVLLANLIAWPVAWFAMNNWLQNFAYRIEIALWVFLFAAFISVLIAFITVSFQAIKAATANPVKSLRYE